MVESGHLRSESAPLLRIPPFPGAKTIFFSTGVSGDHPDHVRLERLLARIRQLKVGGSYWAAQPELPSRYVLVRTEDAITSARAAVGGLPIVLWSGERASENTIAVTGECDPWHMLAGAEALFADSDDEICIIAAFCGVPAHLRDADAVSFELKSLDAVTLLASHLADTCFADPFTGEDLTAEETVELCGFWRALVDSNRNIGGATGFAFWKRENVAPLLWGGTDPVCFDDAVANLTNKPVAIWRARASAQAIAVLERDGTPLIEVEDGFLRSKGLGADCVPPLSITVDRLGAHFDPSQASELEQLLQEGSFDEQLLERARVLRTAIVEAGLGKYEAGGTRLERPAGARRHILVPGQVEDDRSVLTGGCGLRSNLALIQRVRERAPDAFILYKPHPDVVAGHRKGSIPERSVLEFADQVVTDQPISSLIEMADEVHVNTSLAGFEALMREKPVTTHGVPFYAGWGLTTDLGPVPARRQTERSLDELIAAVLLVYPRYLDPVTGLPCPAEVVVRRLVDGVAAQENLVVSMRRIQGKVMRRLREFAR